VDQPQNQSARWDEFWDRLAEALGHVGAARGQRRSPAYWRDYIRYLRLQFLREVQQRMDLSPPTDEGWLAEVGERLWPPAPAATAVELRDAFREFVAQQVSAGERRVTVERFLRAVGPGPNPQVTRLRCLFISEALGEAPPGHEPPYAL